MTLSFLMLISMFGCSFSAKVGDVECNSSCDNEQETCYNVCETDCVDAGGDPDEECDTDCRIECDERFDSCSFECTTG